MFALVGLCLAVLKGCFHCTASQGLPPVAVKSKNRSNPDQLRRGRVSKSALVGAMLRSDYLDGKPDTTSPCLAGSFYFLGGVIIRGMHAPEMGRRLQRSFAAVPDCRDAHRRRHSLAVCAMFSDARSLCSIHQFGCRLFINRLCFVRDLAFVHFDDGPAPSVYDSITCPSLRSRSAHRRPAHRSARPGFSAAVARRVGCM